MSSAPYAVVDPSGNVTNIVQWDGTTPYDVSPNTLVAATSQPNAQAGGTYLNGVFTAPAAPVTPQGIIQLSSPTTGSTVQIANPPQPQKRIVLGLEPATALATLTAILPPAPQDGDDVYVISTKAITTFNVQVSPGQGNINVPPSFALAAGVSQHITWLAQLSAWIKL